MIMDISEYSLKREAILKEKEKKKIWDKPRTDKTKANKQKNPPHQKTKHTTKIGKNFKHFLNYSVVAVTQNCYSNVG